MREHARVSNDELDLLAAFHLKCFRPVGHRAVTFLHRDFHDAKRLLGIAGLARRKVSFSFMRVQARAGAKHAKRRKYYFDPKSSGYPEAHRQTPQVFAPDAPCAVWAEIELNLESSRKIATICEGRGSARRLNLLELRCSPYIISIPFRSIMLMHSRFAENSTNRRTA